MASPNPAGATGAPTLYGVKTFSATDAWAVGSYSTAAAPIARTLIEHWNGASWSIVPSPNPDAEVNLLTDVDGAAPNDVWAIGNVGHETYGGTPRNGLVLHWDGSAWSQVNVPGSVSDGTINFPTLEDVTRVGQRRVDRRAGVQLDGVQDRADRAALERRELAAVGIQRAPNDGAGFQSVAALSSTQVYAVGQVIARWTGTAWVLDSGSVSGGSLVDMAAVGPSTFWAVGTANGGGPWRCGPPTVDPRPGRQLRVRGAVRKRARHRGGAVLHAQALEDVLEVFSHRGFGDREVPRDLAVGVADRDQPQQFALAVGEVDRAGAGVAGVRDRAGTGVVAPATGPCGHAR